MNMAQTGFFLIVTVILWGLAPILEKIGLKTADVFTGLFIRTAAVFLVLLGGLAVRGNFSSLLKVPIRTVFIFSVSGICAGLLAMVTYYKLLRVNPSSKIVPLAAVYPLITAILGIVILKEPFSWARLVGTVFIITGVFLVKI